MKAVRLLIFISTLCAISSCKVLYPNLMFQQHDYKYIELAQKQVKNYLIEPGDQFSVQFYSRNGFKVLDIINNYDIGGNNTRLNTNQAARQNILTFLVDHDGFVKMPIVGNIYVQGYSEPELESILQEKLASLYVDPFVVVTVSNRRAFVFTASAAEVIPLNQAPTKLIEVIAKAGGIPTSAKAYKIRLIRGDMKNPTMKLIDLSTIAGIQDADLIVQSNDIIYIEPRRRVVLDAVRELLPYMGIITSFSSFILLFNRL